MKRTGSRGKGGSKLGDVLVKIQAGTGPEKSDGRRSESDEPQKNHLVYSLKKEAEAGGRTRK